MLARRVEWFFGVCNCTTCESTPAVDQQTQISLAEDWGGHLLRHPPGHDSLDITFTPRQFGHEDGSAGADAAPLSHRQRGIKDGLQLPSLQNYPVPPNAAPGDTEVDRARKLLHIYQEVAIDLHTGVYLTQLTADRDYSDIHCQLMEDLTTLKLDQNTGRIIEFPLVNVSKVYRIVKCDDKFFPPGSFMPHTIDGKTDHIVVVEFLRRKLAFVYKEAQVAQRFMIAMELLIRRAQQKQALRSLTPTFPPRQADQGQCPTPKQVYEAMSRAQPGDSRAASEAGSGGRYTNLDRSL
uniref:Uncharacterized protein n=1 Tax=Zooxanthella nutricula TaxID=1333877 RepID=A0A6U6L4G3_9DINO|mmetsp:Transcript_30208/g.91432  ORF Transcript_30208/g.91432 Transcript_30208/m.91432 type:complete len:294 (+) Transcript_30208:3-884(+)